MDFDYVCPIDGTVQLFGTTDVGAEGSRKPVGQPGVQQQEVVTHVAEPFRGRLAAGGLDRL